ncbi:MAG: LysR family transcriptional regulator [Reyranellaceae bacterium]
MDPFAGIEVFARVVETGSITAAAQALQTAKSSVSETVKALEERLGVRLLDRTTRKLRPTEAGAAFYTRCRRLIEEAENARAEAQALQQAPAGRIRVATPQGFAALYIVPSLPGFYRAYPGIEIELVEGAAVANMVEDGIDLAIRVVDTPEPTLVVRRIASMRVIVVASPDYLAAAGAPRRPADLAGHNCVGFSPLAWRGKWRLGAEEIALRPRLLSDSSDSLLAAAEAGLGVVAMPDWIVAEALRAGRLKRVLARFETPVAGIYAVYPTRRLITPRVRVFVDHIVRALRAAGVPA